MQKFKIILLWNTASGTIERMKGARFRMSTDRYFEITGEGVKEPGSPAFRLSFGMDDFLQFISDPERFLKRSEVRTKLDYAGISEQHLATSTITMGMHSDNQSGRTGGEEENSFDEIPGGGASLRCWKEGGKVICVDAEPPTITE